MKTSMATLTVLSFLCWLPATAATIRVPADQPTIQAGIDTAAEGDTVLVAEGYYRGPGNREIDFKGKAILVTSETGRSYSIIDCAESGRGVHFHQGEGADSILRGFTIRNGRADRGGGILCEGASPTMESILIEYCEATDDGGGICCHESSAIFDDTIIYQNRVDQQDMDDGAGGIHLSASSPEISNSIICWNEGVWGGGVHCANGSNPRFINCLICSNNAYFLEGSYYHGYEYGGWGGAIFGSTPIVENCTVAWNKTFYGDYAVRGSSGTISNSILWNERSEVFGDFTVTYCDVKGGYAGVGNIDADPFFVQCADSFDWGHDFWTGRFFLSQQDAGQTEQSPCVDAGSAPAETFGLDTRSTRTDFIPDTGTADLGFHYPVQVEEPQTRIEFGPHNEWVNSPVLIYIYTGVDLSDPPSDLVYSHQVDEGEWSEYSAATKSVIHTSTLTSTQDSRHDFRVRCKDTEGNIDPIPATAFFHFRERVPTWWSGIVTGPGPGPDNPPLVRTSEAEWFSYGVLKYGVNVACANLDGKGLDEVITGPGPGADFGPHVRGWTLDGQPVPGVGFMAYGTYRFGVNVASGDIDADGYDEIITGAAPGAVFGPHVRGWNYDGSGTVTPMGGVSYFAYGTPKWGVNVTAGDVDGDGYDEIITGAGPGEVYGPHVRGWNCDGDGPVAPIPEISFMAYGTHKWGVNVACGDLDGDGDAEIITGSGPGPDFAAHVRAWTFDGARTTPMKGVSYFAYHDSLFGVRVAAGDVDGDGIDEILTVRGPTPELNGDVRVWSVENGEVVLDRFFPAYDFWITYGGSIAGGHLN